jgi:hypothetical protein
MLAKPLFQLLLNFLWITGDILLLFRVVITTLSNVLPMLSYQIHGENKIIP